MSDLETKAMNWSTLSVRSENGNTWVAHCNAHAMEWGNDELHLFSVVGDHTTIRAITATLNDPRLAPLIDLGNYYRQMKCSKAGYQFYRHQIQPGWWHLLAVSRSESFLPVADRNSIWSIIRSDRFTTPVLSPWSDYILSQALNQRHIQELDCWQCKAGWLTLTDEGLDRIVSEGVQQGLIKVPTREAKTC